MVERYERSAKYWDPRFEAVFSGENSENVPKHDDAVNGLAEWLETTTMEDGETIRDSGCGHNAKKSLGFGFIDGKTIDLYQCSHCRNPSANLKKCSRCGNARYCDEQW